MLRKTLLRLLSRTDHLRLFVAALGATADLSAHSYSQLVVPSHCLCTYLPTMHLLCGLIVRQIGYPVCCCPTNQGALILRVSWHTICCEWWSPFRSALSDEQIMIPTVQEENVGITTYSEDHWKWSYHIVSVNNANVIAPDVLATNSAIHVIDAILVPPSIKMSLTF